ncbi:glyoxalase [Sulfitobacter sp. SK012]|uniref:VOC family protein n=1 Tax=Sulfitobacter sp. SK012 TaxID=1389005 RepID=UPI000E0B4A81|nr:VOC family protein [Sulfitobacter sp. SK012]AXI47427.1 glyoxalase [Sulfitobacter sp. SK012]
MEQRISLITLGARDPALLADFYEALGWRRVETPDGIIAFDLIGQALGLYPLDKLAEDMGRDPKTLGHGAATFSHNVAYQEQVGALMDRVEAAGGEILRPASDVFWGGHIGYFSDPEGHVWEVAHNPFSTLGPNGEFRWNGYG